jgi:hypothetical protein
VGFPRYPSLKRFSVSIDMRRYVAALVLGVFAWSFFAPVALAVATDTTPACCRRTGKHHCMSGTSGVMSTGDKGPEFRTSPSCCPYHSETATPTPIARVERSRTITHCIAYQILAVKAESARLLSDIHSDISPRGPPGESLHS